MADLIFREARLAHEGKQMKLSADGFYKIPARPFPLHRKHVVITNEDNTGKVYVIDGVKGDPAATVPAEAPYILMTIFPNESKVIETSGDVWIKANAGSAITYVQILESYYAPA